MDRRKFINIVLGGSFLGWLVSLFYPVISFLKPPPIPEANINSIKVGSLNDFQPDSAQIVQFGRKPVIVIRTGGGSFKAFDATCTHLDCIVQYRKDTKQILCACHNGIYDLKGRNVSGPPPRPLDELNVNIIEDEVIVSKPTEVS